MQKTRLMVVEDETIVAVWLKESLEGLGYEVPAMAADGLEVQRLTAEASPDLILMDIRLRDDSDGVELADWIKRMYGIPVVFVTAHTDPATLDRAKRVEPYGFLAKPIEEKNLRSVIEVAIYKSRQENLLAKRERMLGDVLRSVPVAVLSCDMLGSIEYANSAAKKLFAETVAELETQKISDVVNMSDIDTGEDFSLPIASIVLDCESYSSNRLCLSLEDRNIPVTCSVAPRFGGSTGADGIVIALRTS